MLFARVIHGKVPLFHCLPSSVTGFIGSALPIVSNDRSRRAASIHGLGSLLCFLDQKLSAFSRKTVFIG